MYLEGKKLSKMEDVRDSWETWMSGRQSGNFYKALGGVGDSSKSFGGGYNSSRSGSASGNSFSGGVGGVGTCFNCGGRGHRASECRMRERGTRVVSNLGTERPVTCFSCGKSGHRSVDCPSKRVGSNVKKEGPVGKISKIIMGAKKGNVAWGDVNGIRSRVLIDSGAEVA